MIAATATATVGHVNYTEAAPLVDVMFEQLDFLVAHQRTECPEGCSECLRLEQVRKWLLFPFRDAAV